MSKSKIISCRLCDREAHYVFDKLILNKYSVGYYRCVSCESLQVEPAYWLDEAYSTANLSYLDTGAAQRNINRHIIAYLFAKLYRCRIVHDFGGGDGLLCRLLRDYEINCFVVDKYATNMYAQGFDVPEGSLPDLVLAFETIEHFKAPADELDSLFVLKPMLVVISTQIYSNQDDRWWYLSPESGQHIFFYSTKSVEFIASKYGYRSYVIKNHVVFSRSSVVVNPVVLKFIFSSLMQRAVKIFLSQIKPSGYLKDYLRLNSGRQSISKL